LSWLAVLRSLCKLASGTDRLSRLTGLTRLHCLALLIELVLTRLAGLDDLALLAGANLARLILPCLGLLILLRRWILPEAHAANAKRRHESDKHSAHCNAPEKWTSRTLRLLRSDVRKEFPPAPPNG